ncbi:conserved unknown protein [Ectocarpus siliculosus]|uniref:Uncharacterized protein n=1 Tax=Ectocarpus siliculosus TaxID=2880 RepID=D7FK45_ECTSI|nr:conserved unknown protein [Ectocarpus siliculosus]|eukprot:CBJ29255.1 conserved unknown protein [Ectocarpus siliculosus]
MVLAETHVAACGTEEVSATSIMVILLFGHPAILLLILSVARAGNIDARFIAPSEALEGERFVSSFGEDQTTEDRRSYLQAARERGYTCSMLPKNYPSAVALFCAKACRGAVEEALATQPFAEVTLVHDDQAAVIRATVDEEPWLKVLQSFMEPSFAANFHPSDCSVASSALAFGRAKTQVLPALRALAGRSQSFSSTATTANTTMNGVGGTASVFSRRIAAMKPFSSLPVPAGEEASSTTKESVVAKNTQPSSSASSSAMPHAGRIANLLALLDDGNERSGMVKTPPFLRMKHPSLQERVSGGVVNVVIEVVLGAVLRTSLLAAATTNDGSSSRVDTAGIESGYRSVGEDKSLADYDRCVIRAVVDGMTSSSTPIDIEDVFNNDGEAAVVMQMDIVPTYDHNPHCSEHPARALAGWSAWAQDEDVWRLDARAVDRVCTQEAFGAHHIHGELAAFDTCSKAFGPFHGILVNVNDCVDLVTSVITAKRVDLFNTMSLRLTAYLRSIRPNYLILGHTGAFPQKVEALGAVLRDGGDRVEKICEVGFNAGHSSLNWLLNSRPSTKVLAFDLGEYEYMRHALDFLQMVFPGRLEVLIGHSTVTIPAYAVVEEAAGRDTRTCNVLFVDGDHTEEGAYADLINFRALASR